MPEQISRRVPMRQAMLRRRFDALEEPPTPEPAAERPQEPETAEVHEAGSDEPVPTITTGAVSGFNAPDGLTLTDLEAAGKHFRDEGHGDDAQIRGWAGDDGTLTRLAAVSESTEPAADEKPTTIVLHHQDESVEDAMSRTLSARLGRHARITDPRRP